MIHTGEELSSDDENPTKCKQYNFAFNIKSQLKLIKFKKRGIAKGLVCRSLFQD